MSNVIQFPISNDRLWRDFESQVKTEGFPRMGVRADEEQELMERLYIHWTWIRGKSSFSFSLPIPERCTPEEFRAILETAGSHSNELLAGWYESMRAAIVQLAKVEFERMRSVAGGPPPFDSLVSKPPGFDKL